MKKYFNIYRMKSIKYIFLKIKNKISKKPVGDTYYGEIAKNYLEDRVDHPKWVAEQNKMTEILDYIPDNITVLDVPFGTGRFVQEYKNKNFNVYGLELSKEMIDVFMKNNGKKYDCNLYVGDASKMPFDDNKFDLVVSFRFLHNIIDYKTAKMVLKEISRVSSSKAIIEINIRKDSAKYSRKVNDNEIIGNNFKFEKISKLFDKSGLKIDHKFLIQEQNEAIVYALLCSVKY